MNVRSISSALCEVSRPAPFAAAELGRFGCRTARLCRPVGDGRARRIGGASNARMAVPRKPGRRDRNVVPMKSYRRRRPNKLRRHLSRAKLVILVTALVIGVAYNFDELAAEFRGMLGSVQPQVVSGGKSDLSGRVTHVRDGDTVEVSGVPVRIANLDCAESGTAAGERAAERMRQLANLGPFSCRLECRKSYDREVSLCQLADGRDVGEVLIGERQCGRWY